MAEWIWDEKEQRWKSREEVEEEAKKKKQLQDIGSIIDAVINYITSNYVIKFDPVSQTLIIRRREKQ